MIFNKKTINKIFSFFLLFFLFFSPAMVLADYSFSSNSGLDLASKGTGHTDSKIFQSDEDISVSLGSLIQILLSFLGVIFVVLIVYSGILWMTAMGNDQQVDKAKKIISESIIGLVIVVLAYSISFLVIKSFNFQ